MTSPDERMRILKLVESGQISAEEGARLLDALGNEAGRDRLRPAPRPRSLRVLVTDLSTQRQKTSVSIPSSLVAVGLKLGARLLPRSADAPIERVMEAVEAGRTGRIFEYQDLEENERIEIIIE
jgi:hypothetical protein